jgi:hypothetical protein
MNKCLKRPSIALAGFVVMALFATGCAMFPGNMIPPAGPYKPLPEGATKSRAVYTFSAGFDMLGSVEQEGEARVLLQSEFTDAFYQSGYFDTLSSGGDGDMIIRARLVNSGTPLALCPAVLTGLSLYVIPSWVTDLYEVTVTVVPRDGKERFYQYSDSSKLVQWLPMIFAFPTHDPVSVSKEVRINIWKTVAIKMRDDGLFSLPAVKNAVDTPQQPAAPDVGEQMKKLKELHDKGLLTDEEFNKRRALLLEKL